MSYLLYCIVHANHEEPRGAINLLGYPHASIMVHAAGLGAVLSEWSRADFAPDVPRLLAYASTIESFNRSRSVIPIRFGAKFANLAEVEGMLERERRRYEELLREFEGRIEMSVYASIGAPLPPSKEPHALPLGAGLAYLETRRRHYDSEQDEQRCVEQAGAAVCRMAQGLFVRHTRPAMSRGDRNSFSIHFLVSRDRVAAFSEALRPVVEPLPRISGPWPPYNFAHSG